MAQDPNAPLFNIETTVNYKMGLVTFKERAAAGLVIVNAAEITVPLALLVRIVSQGLDASLPPQIRALDFLTPRPPDQQRPDQPPVTFNAPLGGKH